MSLMRYRQWHGPREMTARKTSDGGFRHLRASIIFDTQYTTRYL